MTGPTPHPTGPSPRGPRRADRLVATIGAGIVLALVWVALAYAHELSEFSRLGSGVRSPGVLLFCKVFIAIGVTGAAWVFKLVLRDGGDEYPVPATMLFLVAALAELALWPLLFRVPAVDMLATLAAYVVVVACLIDAFIRWRQAGRRLRPRVPLAVLTALALIPAVGLAAQYPQRQAALDQLAGRHIAVLDLNGWRLVNARIEEGDITVVYGTSGAADGFIEVTTPSCRDTSDEDACVNPVAPVPLAGSDSETLRVPHGDQAAFVTGNPDTGTTAPGGLVDSARHIRPATTAETRHIADFVGHPGGANSE